MTPSFQSSFNIVLVSFCHISWLAALYGSKVLRALVENLEIIFFNYLEAENGIEPMLTELQSAA